MKPLSLLLLLALACDGTNHYIYVPGECAEDTTRCEKRHRPHLESGATVTDTQLRYTRALALGTPAPQADEHAPWCPRLPGCMGGCWGNGSVPRDTTGRASAKLRMNDPFPTVFWPFVGGRGF